MALGLSRKSLGAFYGVGVNLAGPSQLQPWCYNSRQLNLTVRGYVVAATAQKQRTPPTGKSTTKNSTLKAASIPKLSTKTSARATPTSKGSPNSQITSGTSASSRASAPVSGKTQHKPSSHIAGGMSYTVPEKKEFLTEEEQMEQLDQIKAMARLFPSADPWGQRVETLDVKIPYSVKPSSRKGYPSWGAMLQQFFANRNNAAKNATSLLMLAQTDAIPGLDLSEATRTQKYLTQWPWRILTTTSLKPNAWLAPLRKTALSTYQQLNQALARQDDKTVKQLTSATYYDDSLRLLKKNHKPGLTYIWRFHREVTPTRVISIRATEGYLATEEPKIGNRMMVHALVRVDTEQSLEIYDRRGNPMHTPPTNLGSGRPPKATVSGYGNCPAERRRVTEYLVFEKRMWYDGPWVIREQLWEAPGKEAAI